MSTIPGRLRAWIELARLSNAPTVISNALTGAAIGLASGEVAPRLGPVLPASAGMVVLYVAGMLLNDAADAGIDRVERPGRPIPSGRISRRAAWLAGVAFLIGGVALCAPGGAAALVLATILAAAILVYDLVHKATVASILLLGLCRALVYLTVAASLRWPVDWSIAAPLAGALGLYVVLLSVAARVETAPRPAGRGWLVPALLLVALSPAAFLRLRGGEALIVVAVLAVAASLLASLRHLRRGPPRIGRAVGEWLAGLCLLDALYLVLLERPVLAAGAAGCFVATIIGHRFVKGT